MAIKNKKLSILFMVVYDVITIFLSTLISTLLTAPKCEEYIFYAYYVPSYISALVFLQVAIYFVLEIYKIDSEELDIRDVGRIAIATGVVLICNMIFVAYTGWFNYLWVLCYAGIALLFTCSHRFIMRAIARSTRATGLETSESVVE